MNPFENEIFINLSKQSTIDKSEIEKIISITPPTFNQILDFILDSPNGQKLIEKLYFVYQTPPIANIIGWFKFPDINGIGGFLNLEFYDRLYTKTDFKNGLFPFLPGEVQTEKRLISYLQQNSSNFLSNYHGEKPSTKTLEWLITNQIYQIKYFHTDWWDKSLKEQVLKLDLNSIIFLPENLLTRSEIIDYLKNTDKKTYNILRLFWSQLSTTFKADPEIFALWLISSGGLSENFNLINSQPYYTIDAIKKYFELTPNVNSDDWSFIDPRWKSQLVDVAFSKTGIAIALDKDIELTDKIVKYVLETPPKILNISPKARFILRLFRGNMLTKEILEKLNISYIAINTLPGNVEDELLSNSLILDFLVKNHDVAFFKVKSNWPKGIKVQKYHIIDIMQALNFNYQKIKSRIVNLSTDDWLWLHFEANLYPPKIKTSINSILNNLIDDNVVTIPKSTMDFVETVDKSGKATYEKFKKLSNVLAF
jgi:hypothetical protein